MPFLLVIIFVSVGLLGLMYLIRRLAEKINLAQAMNYALAEVRLPRQAPEKAKEFKSEIAAFEQLAGALAKFKYPVAIEIAVKHVGEEINFYVAVHRREFDAVLRQIQAFWPKARVERVDDYNIFNPTGEAAATTALLAKNFALPIRTYDALEVDGLAAITNAMARLAEEGEGAAVQFIFTGAGRERKQIEAAAKLVRSGEPLEEAVSGAVSFARSFAEALRPQEAAKEKPVIDAEAQALLERKLRKPLLRVNVRVVASAPSESRAEAILREIEAAFLQFDDPAGNAIQWRELAGRQKEKAIFDFSFRIFQPLEALVLTTEELATAVHLPTAVIETPRVRWAKAAESQPPANLPAEGIAIGDNVFRGEKRTVRLARDDRRRHVYIIGQTGTGKSVLLAEMARQDMEAGEGICFIDPHGDTVEMLLGLVPESRLKDVIYFNPSDIERPMGLNMFEYDRSKPAERTFIVNEMLEIFYKLWEKIPEAFGPMFEQYMRNAMLLVLGDEVIKPTIMDIPRVLADAAFRRELLARSANPPVVEFWTKEAEKAGGEASLANMVPYITSKLNPFIANDIVRPIIGQPVSAFRPREVMDGGKILLVNLAKGILGETNSFLLGMILVSKIFMAALARVNQPESSRRDFFMYLDEFQNVTTATLASILSEARKYRLSLTMAHQFIAQLREDVRDAVFGNVGTLIAFRVGPQDAEFLAKQFTPTFSAEDLVNIDNFNAYVKPLIYGQTARPFNIQTYPPARPNLELAAKAEEISRAAYGRPRADVEAEIFERFKT